MGAAPADSLADAFRAFTGVDERRVWEWSVTATKEALGTIARVTAKVKAMNPFARVDVPDVDLGEESSDDGDAVAEPAPKRKPRAAAKSTAAAEKPARKASAKRAATKAATKATAKKTAKAPRRQRKPARRKPRASRPRSAATTPTRRTDRRRRRQEENAGLRRRFRFQGAFASQSWMAGGTLRCARPDT